VNPTTLDVWLLASESASARGGVGTIIEREEGGDLFKRLNMAAREQHLDQPHPPHTSVQYILLFPWHAESCRGSVLPERRYPREREREIEREREKRLHSPFALHAPIQRAIQGYVIKKRG
jgi:hypothetical protein